MKNIKLRTLFRHQTQSVKKERSFFVKSDKKRLQQVLLNLVSNAIKFTNRDGKILVVADLFWARLSSCPLRVNISVVDSGMGVERHHRRKLFKLFGSYKNEKSKINTNGIGIGLVISRLIVSKFGGDISFFTKPQKGSIFKFSFELSAFTKNELRTQLKQERLENEVE